MPYPLGIGALITINYWQRRMTEEEASRLDHTVVNFCAPYFAKLDTGDVVFAPPPAMGLGVPRWELADMDLAAFSTFVAETITMRPPEHLAAQHADVYVERWDRLATELKRLGVLVRADELIEMPFETIVDQEVRQLLKA